MFTQLNPGILTRALRAIPCFFAHPPHATGEIVLSQYQDSIIKFLTSADGEHVRIADLAERLNIAPEDRGDFEKTVEQLAVDGRIVWGPGRSITLPAIGNTVSGVYRQTTRGFGFVIPDQPNAHGDLFIAIGDNMDAITGDFVKAKVVVRDKNDTRDSRRSISGRIIEILPGRRTASSARSRMRTIAGSLFPTAMCSRIPWRCPMPRRGIHRKATRWCWKSCATRRAMSSRRA